MNGMNSPGKETVEKDDGRYIIFYSFEGSEKEGRDERDEEKTPDSDDTNSLNGRRPGG